jgi:hypothetical protein
LAEEDAVEPGNKMSVIKKYWMSKLRICGLNKIEGVVGLSWLEFAARQDDERKDVV